MATSRYVLVLAVAAVAAVTSAGTARAAAPAFVIQGDRVVGGIVLGRTTLPQAAQRLRGHGAPRLERRPSSCVATWRKIGISVDFRTIGSDRSDPCRAGVAVAATITSRTAWRTAVGLRVRDGVSRVRRLFPRPRVHAAAPDAGWWLVPRRACAEGRRSAVPGPPRARPGGSRRRAGRPDRDLRLNVPYDTSFVGRIRVATGARPSPEAGERRSSVAPWRAAGSS